MNDYYKTLGVENTATKEQIKKAYRKLSLQFHPDRPNGNAEKFKQINEAYETLNDEQKKRMYCSEKRYTQYSNTSKPFERGSEKLHWWP